MIVLGSIQPVYKKHKKNKPVWLQTQKSVEAYLVTWLKGWIKKPQQTNQHLTIRALLALLFDTTFTQGQIHKSTNIAGPLQDLEESAQYSNNLWFNANLKFSIPTENWGWVQTMFVTPMWEFCNLWTKITIIDPNICPVFFVQTWWGGHCMIYLYLSWCQWP